MNKFVSVLLSLLIFITSIFICNPITANAADTTNRNYIVCNGYYVRDKGSYQIRLDITGIDFENEEFKGLFTVSGSKTFFQEITGIFKTKDVPTLEGFEYLVSFDVSWGDSSYYLDLNDSTGHLNGGTTCSYEGLIGRLDCNFYGTANVIKNSNKISTMQFDEDLYEECKNLSVAAYKGKLKDQIPSKLKKKMEKDYEYRSIMPFNFKDDIETNVSFALGHKTMPDGKERCIVVIRGTDGIEWEGNMKICPPDDNDKTDKYTFKDADDKTHYNFLKAADDLKKTLLDYINGVLNSNNEEVENINTTDTTIVITGHSRGGAVANLLAKNITNDANFNTKVTAYTFATPNVAPYTDNPNMEAYTNIYNFCNFSDFIPYIPIIGNSWNYWKYGKSYITSFNADDVDNGEFYCLKLTNIMSSDDLATNVSDYYNKKFNNDNNESVSLYDFMINCLAKPMANNITALDGGIKATVRMNDYSKYKGLTELSEYFSNKIIKIGTSHMTSVYEKLSFSDYHTLEYNEILSSLELLKNNEQEGNEQELAFTLFAEDNYDEGIYNPIELARLRQFLQCEDNNDVSNATKLGYDINDPLTWSGVEFNSNNKVCKIDLVFDDLYGYINLSDFDDLTNVDLSANYITSIGLDNCNNLTKLDVSDNELTSIDLSDCSALNYLNISSNSISTVDLSNNSELLDLNIYNCELNTLDISNLSSLVSLDCNNNNLSDLNITNNTNLNKLYCMMNYLDLTNESLINSFDVVETRNGSEVVYTPQYLPKNAIFDTTELQTITALANSNTSLDLLDDNGQLDIEKAQLYFAFKKINNVYRVVTVDLSNENISGVLDCNSFTYLKKLYCEKTGITNLLLASCQDLEVLVCNDCNISTLTLPMNSGTLSSKIYNVSCENNHIDINIFSDAIVNSIKSKQEYELSYAHQLLNANIDAFDESEYELLCEFYNQYNNSQKLGWDLENPGEWDYISWKYSNLDEKYHIFELDFDFLNVSGRIDLSTTTNINSYSFAGSTLTTAILPDGEVPSGAFYDCKRLEAVILSEGTTAIGESAFKYCTSLQAVYIPDSVTTIGNDVFKYSPNVKIAGVSDSFAENYATTSNIPFEAGYFVCANVVTKEAADENIEHFYPVEGVNLLDENNETISISDKYGYFVLFGLNEDDYTNTLSYKYGYDLEMISHISNSSIIVLTPIQMVSYDFVKDGYINAKDYKCFVDMKKNDDTDENYKYYDIDKNGIVDENDWCFAQEFFLQSNSIKDTVEAGYDLTNYLIAPLSLNDDPDNSSGPIEVGGIEDIYVDFD